MQNQGTGEWMATYNEIDIQAEMMKDPTLKARWHIEYGDRQTELVFIGIEMNITQIIQDLDGCLLNDDEMKQDWSTFNDPLPQFTVVEPVEADVIYKNIK